MSNCDIFQNILDQLDDKPISDAENEKILSHIEELFNILFLPILLNYKPKIKHVLEIGCGDGKYGFFVKNYVESYVGIDIRKKSIKAADELLKDFSEANVLQTNGIDLKNFDDKSKDFIFSYQTFYYMPSKEIIFNYLEEVLRVLNDDGIAKIQLSGNNLNNRPRVTWKKIGQAKSLTFLTKYIPSDFMVPMIKLRPPKSNWGEWGSTINPYILRQFIQRRGANAYIVPSYTNGHLSSNEYTLYWLYITKKQKELSFIKIY